MKIIHIAPTPIWIPLPSNRLAPESGNDSREKQIYDNFLSAVDNIIGAKPVR